MTNPDFLRGPWIAALSDIDGFVYESVEDARENGEDDPNATYSVSIVRGSAAPTGDPDEGGRRLPGFYKSGDQIFDLDDLYLDGDGDISTSADARFAQAQAMAAGLNVAGSAA